MMNMDEVTIMTPEDLGLPIPITLTSVSDTLYSGAVRILKTDGELNPVVFMISDSAVYLVNAGRFFKNLDAQDDLACFLRKATYDLPELIGIVMIGEGWRIPPSSPSAREDEIESREDKEAILSLQCEWCDGTQRRMVSTVTYENADGSQTAIIADPTVSNSFGGRFSTLFPPSRQGGLLN